jgi:hypothetical protein
MSVTRSLVGFSIVPEHFACLNDWLLLLAERIQPLAVDVQVRLSALRVGSDMRKVL